MLPRPSRLKSVASEFSPVLTTPPPVEPNTVLVLMSVPPMMLSSNLTVRRRRAAISAATPARAANAPPPITQPGVLPKRSSKNDVDFAGALASTFGAGGLAGGAAFGGSTGAAAALGGSGAFVSGAIATFGGGSAAFGGSAFGGSAALAGGGSTLRRRRRRGTGGGADATVRWRRDRRARRRRHRGAGLPALERERALQILQRLFELGDAGLRLSQRLVARDDLFRDLALARLRRHLELIAAGRCGGHPFLDGRADSSARGASRHGLGRRGRARDLVLVAAPIRCLHADGSQRLVRRASPQLASALGMLRIAPARSRFMLPSNAFGLLLNSATSICSSVTSAACIRRRSATACRRAERCSVLPAPPPPAAPPEPRRGCGRASGRRRRRRRGRARARRRDRIDRRSGHSRRIEQERVLAHDATRRPVDVDHQVEIRLDDAGWRRDPEDRATVGQALDGDTRAREHALVGEIVLPIERRIGDARGERTRAPRS